MKSESGIGHIRLTIIFIIIVLIAVCGVHLILKENTNITIEDLTTNMLLVQGKIKVLAQENNMDGEEYPLIGDKLADDLENEIIKKLIDDGIIDKEEEDFDNYYLIDKEDITKLKLEEAVNEEYYVVNYVTYEIIYPFGISIDNNMEYRLSALLELREGQEDNKQDNEEENNKQEKNEEQDGQTDETEETQNEE